MPHLKTVVGGVDISDNNSITSIDLPQLESVGKSVGISYNNSLTSIEIATASISCWGFSYKR